MSEVEVKRNLDSSGRIESEVHTATINFRRLLARTELDNVLNANGPENIQVLFVEPDKDKLSPMAYFTFKGKPEFYCVEATALPAQKSLTESASEAVVEKYNALQETLTGALKSDTVEDVKIKAGEAVTWAKGFFNKK